VKNNEAKDRRRSKSVVKPPSTVTSAEDNKVYPFYTVHCYIRTVIYKAWVPKFCTTVLMVERGSGQSVNYEGSSILVCYFHQFILQVFYVVKVEHLIQNLSSCAVYKPK
jgi:hypothetical protein